jgi:hypothetical protein
VHEAGYSAECDQGGVFCLCLHVIVSSMAATTVDVGRHPSPLVPAHRTSRTSSPSLSTPIACTSYSNTFSIPLHSLHLSSIPIACSLIPLHSLRLRSIPTVSYSVSAHISTRFSFTQTNMAIDPGRLCYPCASFSTDVLQSERSASRTSICTDASSSTKSTTIYPTLVATF